MGLDSQNFDSYLPVYENLPEKWEEAKDTLIEHLKLMANEINLREIGWFLDQEVITGKAFIPTVSQAQYSNTSQNYRTIFRKVVDFGALPNNSSKSVQHGINVDGNFTLIQLYLSATDPVALESFGVMYWANANTPDIILRLTNNNVIVTTKSNYTRFSRSFVVIEYIQEL